MKATLIEDGGAGASSEDFFRSPEFLAAEGVTHTLAVGTRPELALPLIVSEIPGAVDLSDAISPYGYPGARVPGELVPAEIDWSQTGLVSVFVRDRIGGEVACAAATERSVVRIADPRSRSGIRKRLREQIRATERAGYRIEHRPGPQAASAERAGFERAYGETMRRTEAAERYFFDSAYFAPFCAASAGWLLLAIGPSGEPAAGAIAVRSDDVLHYFLGGTADRHLDDSPMKNLFAAMIDARRRSRAPAQPRRRHHGRRRPRALQARIRQRRAPLPHPRGRRRRRGL